MKAIHGLRIVGLVLASLLLVVGESAAKRRTSANGVLDIPRTHKQLRSDLPNLLAFISTEFAVPILAELANHNSGSLEINAGAHSARELLNLILMKHRGYAWEEHSGVVHFYQAQLRNAPGNFLNLKLKKFEFPDNVSDFRIVLRARLYSASQGVRGAGVLISDFPSRELGEDRLPHEVLQNVTGRQILMAAAKLNPKFSSILVFPRAKPGGKADVDYASRNWFWLSLRNTEALPIRVQ